MKLIILIFFILISLLPLYSLDSLDKKISANLYDIYGETITISEIDKILEFDHANEFAIIKKSELLNKNNRSLLDVKSLLESTYLEDFSSRKLYLFTLFRLGLYSEVIDFLKNIEIKTIGDADTLYYITESYYRLGFNELLTMPLETALYQFTDDQRFIELKFLQSENISDLIPLYKWKNRLSSYIRIYSRTNNLIIKSMIKDLIIADLKNMNKKDLSGYYGNYEILPIIKSVFNNSEFDGTFYLDNNNDTFSDIKLEFNNGNLLYKGIDSNYDNIYDFEIYFDHNIPVKFHRGKSYISYSSYPNIDYIYIDNGFDNVIVYTLFKNSADFIIPKNTDLDSFKTLEKSIDKLMLTTKLYFKQGRLYSLWEYKDHGSYLVYSQKNRLGSFDECLFYEKNILKYGLRDFDSDGYFDIYDIYNNGVILNSIYNNSKDENWWENIK